MRSVPGRIPHPRLSRGAAPPVARLAAVALCLAVALRPAPAAASDAPGPAELLWPTDAGRCVTSSFCEFRSGHFHAGIDVSTNGTTGFRCFAVQDGDVVRLRVGCRGYGKAVYLRLRDGRTAVYAHLDRFEGALEDTARAHGRRTGSAYFDREFPPGTFPVRRGDVIAYTGETGVGVPHLHVEIRDAAERPVDPLRAGLRVEDRRAPRVRRIAVTPLEAGASVDGSADTRTFGVHGDEGVTRVIPVQGAIGLSADAIDSMDRCRYQLAPARLDLREGGRALHAVTFDAFAFDETDRLDFQIDPRFSYNGAGRFQHLFRRPGNDLPFLRTEPGEGVLRAAGPGEVRRTFEVLAGDAKNNAKRATITLSFGAPPAIETLEILPPDAAGDTAIVVAGRARAGDRAGLRVEIASSTDLGRTWSKPARVAVDSTGHFRWSAPRSPGNAVPGRIVRARAFDELGVGGVARSVGAGAAPAPAGPVRATAETRGTFLEIRIAETQPFREIARVPPAAAPLVVVAAGDGARIDVAAADTALAFVLRDPWGRDRPILFEAPHALGPGKAETIAPTAWAEVTIPGDALREPAWVFVRAAAAPAKSSGELAALAPAVTVDRGQVPLAADMELLLRPDRPLPDSARVGIFVQEGGGFRYIGGTKERGGWTARTRTAFPIGLFEDRAAPSVGQPRLETRSGRVRLVFSARDGGSGIDCSGVEVLMEGALVPNELDGERGEVVAYPDIPASPGAGGPVEIRVVDRCGNVRVRAATVRLP